MFIKNRDSVSKYHRQENGDQKSNN